jgi:hypothetical protein
MDCSLQHRIRERAYEIWSAEGRTHGRAEQHWLAAERQVLSEMAPQVSAPAEKDRSGAAKTFDYECSPATQEGGKRGLKNLVLEVVMAGPVPAIDVFRL